MTWFDTRDSKDGPQYHQYFSASVDGGMTFLPEARVSTMPSRPLAPGNLALTPSDFRTADSWRINLLSAAGRDKAPAILNAANGKTGDGATFDYSAALGNLEALPPNGVTTAVVWRLRLVDPLRSPNIHIAASWFLPR